MEKRALSVIVIIGDPLTVQPVSNILIAFVEVSLSAGGNQVVGIAKFRSDT
jgi:hypothetical protein